MKKIFIVLGIIGLLIIFVVLYFVVFSKWMGKWQTYENARYNFSIEYPTNWKLGDEEINNAGREIIAPNNNTTCYVYGFANALTGENGKPQTLEEFVQWLVNSDQEEITEQKETFLSQREAIYLHTKISNSQKDAVYTLTSDEGIGLFCSYNSSEQGTKDKEIFDHMLESLKIKSALSSVITAQEYCENLSNGVSTPLKDLQTFFDSSYLEVTSTSRESWDQAKLPGKVGELENKDYSCSPLSAEFENIGNEQVVSKVEWKCELQYVDYKYAKEANEKASLEKDGFSCSEEKCLQDDLESSIFLCTK